MNIALLSTDEALMRDISALRDATPFELTATATLQGLSDALRERECRAALMDLSCIAIDNRDVGSLKREFPNTHFILVSDLHFHPHLRDAIQQNIYACMSKPLEPEEFAFLLRSIEEDAARA